MSSEKRAQLTRQYAEEGSPGGAGNVPPSQMSGDPPLAPQFSPSSGMMIPPDHHIHGRPTGIPLHPQGNFYTHIYRQIVGPTPFYLSCLRSNLNEIWHEGGPLDPNNRDSTKGALVFHLANPCDSRRSPIPLTRAPREGQDASFL